MASGVFQKLLYCTFHFGTDNRLSANGKDKQKSLHTKTDFRRCVNGVHREFAVPAGQLVAVKNGCSPGCRIFARKPVGIITRKGSDVLYRSSRQQGAMPPVSAPMHRCRQRQRIVPGQDKLFRKALQHGVRKAVHGRRRSHREGPSLPFRSRPQTTLRCHGGMQPEM